MQKYFNVFLEFDHTRLHAIIEKTIAEKASPLFTEDMPIRDKWIEFNYSKYNGISIIGKKLKLDKIIYSSYYYLLKI
jgi:hypothetical protein